MRRALYSFSRLWLTRGHLRKTLGLVLASHCVAHYIGAYSLNFSSAAINDYPEDVRLFLAEMHESFKDEHIAGQHSLKFVSPVNEEFDGELAAHSRDAHSYHRTQAPICILYAESTQDVVRFVELCSKYRIEVVSYSKGTSLEGAALPTSNRCAMINFQYMNKIVEFLPQDRLVVVEPGIGWMELNDFLAKHELYFPVDPGPGAGIGGMVGTCCSGTNAMKYGTMRQWVRDLEVVLIDGKIVRTGSSAKKSSAGYNLTQLFCGSEGTLGITTKITLQLTQLPKQFQVVTACFEDLSELSRSVEELLKQQLDIRCLELMDKNMVNLIMQKKSFDQLKENNNVLMIALNSENFGEQFSKIKSIVEAQKGSNIQYASNKQEADQLWSVRKQALFLIQQFGVEKIHRNMKVWTTDVCVPISQLATSISETQKEIAQEKVLGPIIGHVGDGNYHVCFLVDYNDQASWQKIQQINHNMIMRAIQCGGTCTGEHGVGIGKRKYLLAEKGEHQINLMRMIKKVFDPQGLLNPGKIFYMAPNSAHDHLEQH